MRAAVGLGVFWMLAAATPPPSQWIAPEALQAALEQGQDVRVVDVRDTNDFRRAHIRDAMQMPVVEVKHRGFLASHDVVLIYGRANPCLALRLAEELRANQFTRVRVMEGGMEAWVAAGLPSESFQPAADAEPPTAHADGWNLPPRDLERTVLCTEVQLVLIDVDGALEKSSSLLRGSAKVVPLSKAGAMKAAPRSAWVVVSATGAGQEITAAKLRTSAHPMVWWLDGGVDAWKLWRQARTKLDDDKCPTCGK